MIAKPFSPGNAYPADEVARERLTFDKALIGSCTNGSYDDLLQAALVLRAARRQGATKVEREFAIFPGSGGVKQQIERPDPRLGGESIADVFRSVGGEIRQSWCGPCFGQGPDALTRGQRAITSFNRNWQNRMGLGGEGYLASPAVVASSALVGYMAPPGELGLGGGQEQVGRHRGDVGEPRVAVEPAARGGGDGREGRSRVALAHGCGPWVEGRLVPPPGAPRARGGLSLARPARPVLRSRARRGCGRSAARTGRSGRAVDGGGLENRWTHRKGVPKVRILPPPPHK